MPPRKPAADFPGADPQTPLSRRVLVNIKRDQTTATPRVVWQHEIPILEAIFGEGNIEEQDRDALDEGYSPRVQPGLLVHNKKQDAPTKPSDAAGLDFAFIGAPAMEYERLAAVYGRHPEVNQSWVENVYGRFQSGSFRTIVGRPTLNDLPDQQLRSLILGYGYSLPLATFKSSEEERRAAADAHATFYGLDHAALVKLANEVGVELGV